MRTTWHTRAGALLAAVALATVATGCGKDDDKSSSSSTTKPTTTTQPTTTTSTPSSTTGACTFQGSRAPASKTSTIQGTYSLLTVSASSDGCVDTLVFTFSPGTPAPPFEVAPVSPPLTQAASGEPMTVAGSSYLKVVFHPAWTVNIETGQATYTGPNVITTTTTKWVKQLALYDSFEGYVGWYVGTDGPRSYTVTSGTSPATVVVKIG